MIKITRGLIEGLSALESVGKETCTREVARMAEETEQMILGRSKPHYGGYLMGIEELIERACPNCSTQGNYILHPDSPCPNEDNQLASQTNTDGLWLPRGQQELPVTSKRLKEVYDKYKLLTADLLYGVVVSDLHIVKQLGRIEVLTASEKVKYIIISNEEFNSWKSVTVNISPYSAGSWVANNIFSLPLWFDDGMAKELLLEGFVSEGKKNG